MEGVADKEAKSERETMSLCVWIYSKTQ